MAKKSLPIILILLLAFALRIYKLTEIPPGLTHDEANHGRDSINILDGELLFYFPLNYGSEPLYNYVVAVGMAAVGETLFSLRLINVLSGVLTIAALYLWTSWAFSKRTAIIAAGLTAVSFWPIATSRQALRAGLLPFLITIAVIFFWLIVRWGSEYRQANHWRFLQPKWWVVAGFAIGVTATLHTYLAARVLWLLFPVFLLYLALFHRASFREIWRPTLAGLAGAGLMVIPMFAYIQAHPEAETRLQMLNAPLENILSGNLAYVIDNFGQAFLAFFWPGFGDHFLAYNIPGRPVLEIITAFFFLMGIVLSLRRWRQPAYAFLLIWFAIGILPSLITGSEANTTRNMGALPATYIIPAIGFTALWQLSWNRWGDRVNLLYRLLLIFWLMISTIQASGDYFTRWSSSPVVRAAYQHTIIQALNYASEDSSGEPIVISSLYPGPAHDPSLARVITPEDTSRFRWVDARYALIFPGGRPAKMIAPSSTPLHPIFSDFSTELQTIGLHPDDLDPSFTVYQVEPNYVPGNLSRYNFGDALELLEASWSANHYNPGDVAELVTYWHVIDPTLVGPVVPPAFQTDTVLFTHVIDKDGDILVQRDSLEAPSWNWYAGDIFVQIHPVRLPNDTSPGSYEVAVGVYDRSSGDRLPLVDEAGSVVDSHANVVPLIVDE